MTNDATGVRDLPESEVFELKAGDPHYMAYVGPPQQYDYMGATQFRLLCALGLRSGHRLLDFGCGSLRAGRLLIPYLDAGCYYGLEPNRWLVDDAIERQIGRDLVHIKQPTFLYHDDFSTAAFGVTFDFIVAQSIFSHAGADIVETCLAQFSTSLDQDGFVLATFAEAAWLGGDFKGKGWVYPGTVRYQPATVKRMARAAGFSVTRLSWYHPRQRWYLLAKDARILPNWLSRSWLTGATLSYPGLEGSYRLRAKVRDSVRRRLLPAVKAVPRRILR